MHVCMYVCMYVIMYVDIYRICICMYVCTYAQQYVCNSVLRAGFNIKIIIIIIIIIIIMFTTNEDIYTLYTLKNTRYMSLYKNVFLTVFNIFFLSPLTYKSRAKIMNITPRLRWEDIIRVELKYNRKT